VFMGWQIASFFLKTRRNPVPQASAGVVSE
jgi:hypothetical protein